MPYNTDSPQVAPRLGLGLRLQGILYSAVFALYFIVQALVSARNSTCKVQGSGGLVVYDLWLGLSKHKAL